jgi:hypothetical protein
VKIARPKSPTLVTLARRPLGGLRNLPDHRTHYLNKQVERDRRFGKYSPKS